MRKIITGLAVIGVATAGLAATAAPASAQTIKANGTATRGESNKLHRAIDKQHCLTLRESQKIVGARGNVYEDEDGTVVEFTGKRRTSVQLVTVVFSSEDCAALVVSDLTHGRWQFSMNENYYNELPSDD